ncbi:MAG: hypothetical protein KatS3mg031_0277 [Chitinophagales bacterium]|nr:MAG: hypothetical protein KatS3mg031_0277 [Chitinophagales bacterium]
MIPGLSMYSAILIVTNATHSAVPEGIASRNTDKNKIAL